jgi:hypothetical protein
MKLEGETIAIIMNKSDINKNGSVNSQACKNERIEKGAILPKPLV